MAIERQQNWQGQQRIDVPHLRALESGVAADFDNVGLILSNKLPVVVQGFSIITTNAVGNDADALKMVVAGSSLIHYEAAEAGSVYRVGEGVAEETLGPTNPKRVGGFTPGVQNYIGIDLLRASDDSTADIVQFLDPDTGLEAPTTVALARTLGYRIVISTTDFSATPGLAPIAKVLTNASNKVTTITDCRHLLFRLGSGGSNPLSGNPFSWPGGRIESSTAFNVAGDRSLASLKDWMAATMTRLWELGGGPDWYSPTADRNVSMTSGVVFISTGEPFEVVSSNIHWKGLTFVFDNTPGIINEIADQLTDSPGLTNLADGECIYVDVDRSQNRKVSTSNPLQMQKGVLASLGLPSVPGSRWVVAWRNGVNFSTRGQYLPIGSAYRVATTAANGAVRLSATPINSLAPVVATANGGASNLRMGMEGFSRAGTSTSGGLFIGYGNAFGDHDVKILTDSSLYSTVIEGYSTYSTAQKPALKVKQNGQGGAVNYDARIQEFESVTGLTPATSVKSYVESGGAWGLANWEVEPKVAAPTGADPARTKFGVRPSRYWKTNVRLTTTAALPAFTASGSGPTHVLTATANGALSIDGIAVLTSDRVLVSINGIHNGIYVITSPGSGGSPYVLTRAVDCSNSTNTHKDIAVKTTAGTLNTNICWVLANNTTVPFVFETDSMVWDSTTNLTRDLVVSRWFDGSETIIANSPPYFPV
jgi:hypothetical protein